MTLFEPVALGDLRLTNRIVMAPLSRARSDIATRAPLRRTAIYYSQRATAGLIITEACHVSDTSVSRPGGAAIHTRTQTTCWRQVVRSVHRAGGRIVQQIYHVGRKAAQLQMPSGQQPIAPSALAAVGDVTTGGGKRPFAMPRALAAWEIQEIVGQFGAAARRSRQADFDGVEVHASNGYLIDQFLHSSSNRRMDEYGGSTLGRVRFLLEVVDSALRVWPRARVGVRLSPTYIEPELWDENPEALYYHIAQHLGSRRIAYIHIVERDCNSTFLVPMMRRAFGGSVILCGGFSRLSASIAIESNRAEAIAFGKLFIANPDLVARFRNDAALNAPRPDLYRHGGDEGYIDYPFME